MVAALVAAFMGLVRAVGGVFDCMIMGSVNVKTVA